MDNTSENQGSEMSSESKLDSNPITIERNKDFEVPGLKLQYHNEISVESAESNISRSKPLSVSHTITNLKNKIEKNTTFTIGNQMFSFKDVF